MNRLTHLDKMTKSLEAALEASPADFTEIARIERKVSRATSSGRSVSAPRFEKTLMVRVRERGRFGFHRLDGSQAAAAPDAIRQALGQARARPVVPLKAPKAPERLPTVPRDALFDNTLARLGPEEARELLSSAMEKGERSQLEWLEARVVVLNSFGLRRKLQVTGGTLFASSGRGPEAGVVRASARRLDRLLPGGLLDHARSRRARGILESRAGGLAGPRVLAPEAMTALLEEVGRLLSERLGSLAATTLTERCFALLEKSPLSMYDDGGDPTGMPFLFDLKGSAKKRLDLVAEGAGYPLPLGRTSPHHQTGCFSAGGDEVQLTNLFLKPGEASLQDLLSSAGDGVWISALRRLVCFDSDTLYFRAEGRGLRRIHQGRIAEALPDQAITGTLPELFGRVRQVGKASLSRALGEGIFGAATAPAVLLENLGD